ncbi:hypothetical protein QTN25_003492 [Entamoeba marina]
METASSPTLEDKFKHKLQTLRAERQQLDNLKKRLVAELWDTERVELSLRNVVENEFKALNPDKPIPNNFFDPNELVVNDEFGGVFDNDSVNLLSPTLGSKQLDGLNSNGNDTNYFDEPNSYEGDDVSDDVLTDQLTQTLTQQNGEEK